MSPDTVGQPPPFTPLHGDNRVVEVYVVDAQSRKVRFCLNTESSPIAWGQL